MPPIVTGTVVMVIGLNLTTVALGNASNSQSDAWMAIVKVLAVAAISVYAPGPLGRLPILLGGVIVYLVYLVFANGFGCGTAINFTRANNANWISRQIL